MRRSIASLLSLLMLFSFYLAPVAQGAADTTAPSVSVSVSPSSTYEPGHFTIYWSAWDANGVIYWELLEGYNGSSGSPWMSGNSNVSDDYFAIMRPPGVYTYTVRARDAAGNWTTRSASVTVKEDNIAPTASINAPSTAQPNQQFQISWSGYDGQTDLWKYELEVSKNGGYYTSLSSGIMGSNNYYWYSNTAGTYTFRVRVMDDAYNWSSWASDTTVIQSPDTTPPTVSLSGPSSVVGGNSFSVSVNVSDSGSGVHSWEAKVSTNGGTMSPLTSGSSSTGTVSYTSSSSASYHTIHVRARDQAGNWSGYSNHSVNVTPPDSTPPSVSVTGPSSAVSGTSFTVSWNASDSSGVSNWEAYVSTNGGTMSLWRTGTGSSGSSGYTAGSTGSYHTFYVRAKDHAGNWSGYSSHRVNVTAPDTTPPIVVVNGPSSATSGTSFTVTWDVYDSDPGSYWEARVSTNGGAMTFLKSGSGTFGSTTYTAGSAGSYHTFHVRARDAAGNWSNYYTHRVNVTAADTTPPTVTVSGPSSAVSGSNYVISWNATDSGGVSNYEVYVSANGGTKSLLTSGSGGSGSINRTAGTAGSYRTYHVRAKDAAGNWSGYYDHRVDFTAADTTPPTVSLNAPSSVLPNTTFSVDWSASDSGSGLDSWEVTLRVNGGSTTVWKTGTAGSGSGSYTAGAAGSTYTFGFRARDRAGNWSSYQYKTVQVQARTPVLTLTVPPTAYRDQPFTVNWAVDGTDFIKWEVTVSVNGGPATVWKSGTSQTGSGTYIGGAVGTRYTFSARVQDLGGTWGSPQTGTVMVAEATRLQMLDPQVTNITGTSATFTWKTNVAANSWVHVPPRDQGGPAYGREESVLTHSVTVNNLVPGTSYVAELRSGANGERVNALLHFRTADPSVAISGASVSNITETGATFTWTTNIPSNSWVHVPPRNQGGQARGSNLLSTSHSVRVEGLEPGKAYTAELRTSPDGGTNIATQLLNFSTKTPPAPQLRASPNPADAGQTPITTQKDVAVTLTNHGGYAQIGEIFASDARGAFSVLPNSCAGALAAGASCTLVVRFKPQVTGAHSGTVTIRNTSGTTLITLPVAGTGAEAPAGMLSGKVVQKFTGSPVSWTQVSLTGGPASVGSVTTDSDGEFRFTNVPPGQYTLTVSNSLYERFTKTVQIRANTEPFEYVELVPAGDIGFDWAEIWVDRTPLEMPVIMPADSTNTVDVYYRVRWGLHPAGKVEVELPSGRKLSSTGDRITVGAADLSNCVPIRVRAVSPNGKTSPWQTLNVYSVPRHVITRILEIAIGANPSAVEERKIEQKPSGNFVLTESLTAFYYNTKFLPSFKPKEAQPGIGGKEVKADIALKAKGSVDSSGSLKYGMEYAWDRKTDFKVLGQAVSFSMGASGGLGTVLAPCHGWAEWSGYGSAKVGGKVKFEIPLYAWAYKDWLKAGVFGVITVGADMEIAGALKKINPLEADDKKGKWYKISYTFQPQFGVGVKVQAMAFGYDILPSVEGSVTIVIKMVGELPVSETSLRTDTMLKAGVSITWLGNKYDVWSGCWGNCLLSALPSDEVRPVPRDYLDGPGAGQWIGDGSGSDDPPVLSAAGMTAIAGDPDIHTLQRSVYPYSEPDMARSGDHVAMVWVDDNPKRTIYDRTQARMSLWNGSNWGQPILFPEPVPGTADFAPKMTVFPDGSIAVLWDDIKNAWGETAPDLQELARSVEVSGAVYRPGIGWVGGKRLTDDGHHNAARHLSGPQWNNFMAAWIEATGATTRLMVSRFDGTAWSQPEAVADVPAGLRGSSLYYDGQTAYVVYGVPSTNADGTESSTLYSRKWSQGAWGAPTALVTVPELNRSPVLVAGADKPDLLWEQGARIMHARGMNVAGAVAALDEGGVPNFRAIRAADGQIVLTYVQPNGENEADLYATFYDPGAGVWGKPVLLTNDMYIERGAAAVMGGNSVWAVYDQVDPDTESADKVILQRTLQPNVGIVPDSLALFPEDVRPGSEGILSFQVVNTSLQPVSNIPVSVYMGDTMLSTVTIPGPLPSGHTYNAELPIAIPANAAGPVAFRVHIGLEDAIASDNEISKEFLGSKLEIEEFRAIKATAETVLLKARITNNGGSAAPATSLSFRVGDLTSDDIRTETVPSLTPGQSVDVVYTHDFSGRGTEPKSAIQVVFAALAGQALDRAHAVQVLLGEGQLSVSESELAFEDVPIGKTGKKLLTLSNTGTGPLMFGTAGGHTAPFAVASDGCAEKMLLPGESCELEVQFAPEELEGYTSELLISSTDPDAYHTRINLYGRGVQSSTDTTPPVVNVPGALTVEATSASGAIATFKVTATDNKDGIIPAACTPGSDSPFPRGTTTVTCRAEDVAGNVGVGSFQITVVDRRAPLTTARTTPGYPEGAGGWYVEPVTVTLTAIDASAVTTEYSLNNGQTWNAYTAPFQTSAEGLTTVLYRSQDAAGNQEAPQSLVLNLDVTPPVITGAVTPGPNEHGWNTGDVTVTFTCSDDGSDIHGCSQPVTVTQEGVDQSVTGEAVNKAGVAAFKTVTGINIDRTPPVITWTADREPTSHGWYNGAVTVTFACTDRLSGTAQCSEPVLLTAEGADQQASGRAVDKAGHEATATAQGINIDLTPPILSGTPDRAPNEDGWYNADVTVSWTATDALSGIDPATLPDEVVVTGEGDSLSATASVSDKAGNTGLGGVPDLKIDRTAPVTTASSEGWQRTDATVVLTATDNLSGVKTTYYRVNAGEAQTGTSLVLGEGIHTVEFWSVDAAGNVEAVRSVEVKVDKSSPVITAERTPANSFGWNNRDVVVGFTCSDVPSGLASCTEPITVSAEGAGHSVTGTATDLAGNTASVTVEPINIDKTDPMIVGAPDRAPNEDGWYNADVTIRWTVDDALSGIDPATVPQDSVVTAEGDPLFASATVSDQAGNTGHGEVLGIKIDRAAPETAAAFPEGWQNGETTVELTATDSLSGVKSTHYRVDSGETKSGTSLTLGEGIHTVEFWSVDLAGNVEQTRSIAVKVDLTAPVIAAERTPPPNGFGWTNADVTVTFTCGDELSGLASCTEPVTVRTDGAGQSVTGTAVDHAGNTATATVGELHIDKTAPVISGAPDRAPNADGWYNADVTIRWTAEDALSGVDPATVPADTLLDGEGESLSAGASVSDKAGNSASAQVAGIKIDRVAPATLVSVPEGWQTSAATVAFTATDGLSGVKATHYRVNGSDTQTGTSLVLGDGIHTVEYWSVDAAGNVEPAQSIEVRVDQTPPVITAERTPANEHGWNQGDVTVTFTCSDPLSGITACPDPVTVTAEDAGQSVSGEVTDTAGNRAGVTVEPINIDKTAPAISGAPDRAPNAEGWYNADVTIGWTVADALSGIDPATAPADAVLTGEGDTLSASATVSDKAGNSASAEVTGIKIDRVAPVTRAAFPEGWQTSDATVELTATDELSGVKATRYRINGGDTQTGTRFVLAEGVHTVQFWSVDTADNAEAAQSFVVKVDTTNPIITADRTPVNAHGWNNGDVTVTYTCTDNLSGVARCAEPVTLTAEGADQSVTGGTADVAGNTASVTVDAIHIDKAAPTISGAPDRAPNPDGWYNANVTILWTVADSLSGIDPATDPADTVLTGEGDDLSASANVTDKAGNSSSAAVTGIKIDRVAPVTAVSFPEGWQNRDATVVLTPADSLSGVKATYYKVNGGEAQSGTSLVLSEGVHTVEFWSVDVADNVEAARSVVVRVDLTNPVITAARTPANSAGWSNGDVTVTFTCTDALSGIAACTEPITVTTEGAGQSVTGTAADNAGNTSSVTVEAILIDKTAPTISGAPDRSPNAHGWYNADVTVSFTCNDSLSGVARCAEAVLLAGEGGGQSVTGTATDTADNSASATVGPINIDKSAPTISGAPDRPANSAGWYNADVTILWTVSDAVSGIDPATVPANPVLTGEGDGLSASAAVSDKAGNSASAEVTGIKIDRVAPVTRAAFPEGWQTSDATVELTAADALSGVKATHYRINGGETKTGTRFTLAEGVHTVEFWSVDTADNAEAAQSFVVKVDKTNPVIAADRTPANAHGWNNGDVTVSYTCTDNLSGVANCSEPVTLTAEGAGQSVTGTTGDVAGNTASVTVSPINIDKTPPTISGAPDRAPNADGWYKADVTILWTVADSLSGIDPATDPADTVLTGEGDDLSASATVSDKAGNGASAALPGIKIDQVAPVTAVSFPEGWQNSDATVVLTPADSLSGVKVTYYRVNGGETLTGTSLVLSEGVHTVEFWSVDAADNVEAARSVVVQVDKTNPVITADRTQANGHGWNNGDVTVSFTCTDALSGIASCTSPITVSTEGADQSVTGTAVDNAGNAASVTVGAIHIDKTAPLISGAPDRAPNGYGWYNADVTVTFTCGDALSGVDSCTQPVLLSGDGAGHSVTGTVTDKAGNTATATVGPIALDKTAPVIITQGGGVYTVDQTVVITCTASDNLSGLLSDPCAQLLVSAPAHTLPLGTHTVTVQATDLAGNTQTVSVTYTVAVTFDSLSALTLRWVTKDGVSHSLVEKLASAKAASERGQTNAANNILGAYINHVEAQTGKAVPEEYSGLLISLAQALMR